MNDPTADDAQQQTPVAMPPPGTSPESDRRGRRVLRVVALVLAVALVAGAGYVIWDLRSQVDDLEQSQRRLSSSVSSLERQVQDLEFDLDSLEYDLSYDITNVSSSAASTRDLDELESRIDDLHDDICGYTNCLFRGSFNSIDASLVELTDCVNSFIDAWASNGRAFHC